MASGFRGRGGVLAALGINLIVSGLFLPVTANPFDFALITGSANSWLSWHVPLFLYWKFGADYAFLNVAAACAARVLSFAGLSVPAASHIALKLLLVAGNLLCAVALSKLLGRFRPHLAKRLVILWLLSPIVIWVAAIHGQIEPVAAAATLWALWLIAEKRWAAAGFVAGLGAGFEYVSLVSLVAVVALVASRRVSLAAGFRFSAALGLAFAACFGPILSSSIGAKSLTQGLIGHATANGSGIDLKPGSVWLLGGLQLRNGVLESHWLLLLLLVGFSSVAVAAYRVRRQSPAAPFAAAGVTLLAATLLDPTALPQFGVLALAGLSLIALEVTLPTGLIAGAPLLTLIAFWFSSPVYVYFEDVDPHVFASISYLLPQVPVNLRLYDGLATIAMTLEVLGITTWLIPAIWGPRRQFRKPRASLRASPAWFVGSATMELAALAVLGAWSAQAPIWSHVAGKEPATLFDTPYLTSRRLDVATAVSGSVVSGSFAPLLTSALRQANPPPDGVVEYTVRDFRHQLVVGGSADLPRLAVAVPALSTRSGIRVDGIDIEILAHNLAWLAPSSVDGRARIDGRVRFPSSVQLVLPSWAQLVYRIPLPRPPDPPNRPQLVTVHLLATQTVLNGDTAGSPWLRAWYSDGEVEVHGPHGSRWDRFTPSPTGGGEIVVSRSDISSPSLTVPALPILAVRVRDEAFVWRGALASFARPETPWQWALGLLWLGVMLGLLLGVVSTLVKGTHQIAQGERKYG